MSHPNPPRYPDHAGHERLADGDTVLAPGQVERTAETILRGMLSEAPRPHTGRSRIRGLLRSAAPIVTEP